MVAPTLVATYGNPAISATTPQTISVTTAVGDVLVAYASNNNSAGTFSTPTGGTSLTWTLRQSTTGVSGRDSAYIWTATATTAETFTFSLASAGGWQTSFAVLRYSGSTGIGASTLVVTGTSTELSLTTTAANSALVFYNNDFNALDGAARTYDTTVSTVTETTYIRNASFITLYGASYDDAGAIGSKTIGLTAPTGQVPTMLAVEVLGAAGNTPISLADTGTGTEALSVVIGAPTGLTVTTISSTQLNLSWTALPGAVSYDIERDGTVIVTGQAGTTFSDTGLAASSTHNYRVRATVSV